MSVGKALLTTSKEVKKTHTHSCLKIVLFLSEGITFEDENVRKGVICFIPAGSAEVVSLFDVSF